MPIPMSWTKPSVALRGVELALPAIAAQPGQAQLGYWESGDLENVEFLLEVVSNVDQRILFETFTPYQGLEWRRAVAAIRAAVRRWQNGGDRKLAQYNAKIVHGLLEGCNDEIVPQAEPRLTWISDDKFRTSIGRDIDALGRLVRDEEWKATTIMGGSVAEALLLSGLLTGVNEAKAKGIEAEYVAAKEKGWRVEPMDKRDLWKLIAVALKVGLIDDTVASVCNGARNFRNLIHPGRERAEAPCDRGTAPAALSAVENLVAKFSGERP